MTLQLIFFTEYFGFANGKFNNQIKKTMKKLIKLLSLCALCACVFTACSNDDDSDANANVITCNGNVCAHLASAFVGGGVADPTEGHSSRLSIFDKSYTSYPSGEVAKVRIEGFYHTNKTYKGNGDHLEMIRLGFVDKHEVNISLNQGVFEGKDAPGGTNTHVSSVTIHSFSLDETSPNGESDRKWNANIHITIKMDDSSVIEVKYSGKVLLDGMY